MQMTFFRLLVQERQWTTIQTFAAHFTKAARDLAAESGERRLADVTVSRRTFDRWMAGGLKSLPQRDTRRILEYLFQQPVARLFAPTTAADTNPPDAHQSDTLATSCPPWWSGPERGRILPTDPLLLSQEGADVDRRRFLLVGGAAALPLAPGPASDSTPAPPRLDQMTPEQIDAVLIHVREMWHMLVQSDNLLGPRHALDGVRQYQAILQELLDCALPPLREEVLPLASRYAESAAWLHEDCADTESAVYWTQQATGWAVEAGDETMTAWTLFRRAQQATAAGNAAQTISLSRAAQRYDRILTAQMRAAALQQEAHGYALAGDELTCHRLLDQAVAFASEPGRAGDGRSGHGDFATPAYLEAQRAHCWLLLKRPDRAAPLLSTALTELPEVYRRDRGLLYARLATAHAHNGDIDQAVEQGHLALAVARGSGSARTLHETINAVDAMGSAHNDRRVSELAEAIAHR
ncbi:hypothetical protein [Streptomyces mobaraensis]|uniref:XRE family transcriptional regulator n=1 Tax=Streptomyces mobaraensis TaxID=35621 RepID=A0A5N5W129_STRMB|nr:hypothetical protein [Streptomyces mobaraensis]KAB7835494.1 hypothetical protein FRZ00_26735 [Streptomyces mobaraensis]